MSSSASVLTPDEDGDDHGDDNNDDERDTASGVEEESYEYEMALSNTEIRGKPSEPLKRPETINLEGPANIKHLEEHDQPQSDPPAHPARSLTPIAGSAGDSRAEAESSNLHQVVTIDERQPMEATPQERNERFETLREAEWRAKKKAASNLAGWWYCSQCDNMVNPALLPECCPNCGHLRCGECRTY
jgi:rubrerythrin